MTQTLRGADIRGYYAAIPAGRAPKLRCAASRTPTRTAEATTTPRAVSTSSTAHGIATPAAPEAARSTLPGPAATPTAERST